MNTQTNLLFKGLKRQKTYFLLLFLLSLLLVLPACHSLRQGDISSDSPPVEDEGPPSPMDESELQYYHNLKKKGLLGKPTMTVEVLPGDFVGQYSVLLNWVESPWHEKWLVKKSISREQKSKFTEALEAKNCSWLDENIREGQEIQYEVIGITPDKKQEFFALASFHVPTDMLIEGHQHISQWEGLLKSGKPIGRIVFRKNATLQIDDKDFKVTVQEIQAKEGRIISFPLAQKAGLEKEGRHGGSIELHAQKAEGTLHFQLYGESGGDGKRGEPLGIEGKGERGKKGSPAQYRDVQNSCPSGNMDICMSPPRIACTKAPTHGQVGGDGQKGNTGTNGNKGGDSSPLHLDIKEADNFHFTVANSPGAGGKGGSGGPGGEGGRRGAPGNNPVDRVCPDAKAGKKGLQGPKGDKGKEGPAGQSNPVCIRINGLERLGCYDTNHDTDYNTDKKVK